MYFHALRTNSNIVVILPNEHERYSTSLFKQDEVETIAGIPHRSWVKILNRHVLRSIVIRKNKRIRFFAIKQGKNINVTHETATSKKKETNESKKISKGKTQSGSFLNWYDFAYAGRDVVNQLGKVVPDLIKNASSELNNVAQWQNIELIKLLAEGEKKLKGCC